ncbi:MAG TPA: hypothetical protein VLA72_08355 [Anaerolineales bacterium]|nr:hypothetical protein [Anaerolineales bacterium]
MNQSTLSNPRAVKLALWGGILFSIVFTAIIGLADPLLKRFVLDAGDGTILFYDWQLAEPTLMGRITAWSLYAVHQIILWGLIYYAQNSVKKYSKGLHPVNLWALGINAMFVVLHLFQTHLWYDALAMDMSSFTSQGSVILMLCFILVLENNRRGMFFGAKAPFSERVMSFARKYHGYLFAWAIVYTFWFHPMVSTPGHLAGFFYTFLLMLQGSLFLTRIHVNKWWMLVQEVTVLVHGTVVAIFQGADIWQMFFFGFAAMFVVTQMHGLNLSRLTRWIIGLGYALAVILVYNSNWSNLNEIIRIPVIEYLVAFIMAGLVALGFWIKDRIKKPVLY